MLYLWIIAIILFLAYFFGKKYVTGDLSIEHGLYAYFGRLGQGKTYAMVRDVIEVLNQGYKVVVNYKLSWNGYDQLKNPFMLFLGFIGLKREFYSYPASNLRYVETDENWHKEFEKSYDEIWSVDEAYILWDSYEMAKLSMSKRLSILQCRKYDRSLWYTVQRPTSVHAVLRGMTNVFYECEKWNTPFGILFARNAYDLDADEGVDKNNRLSRKLYRGDKKFFDMYDTKELVGISNNIKNKDIIETETYKITTVSTLEMWRALARHMREKVNKK